MRVWDVLFYEGAKVLFHVALAIFKVCITYLFYLCYDRQMQAFRTERLKHVCIMCADERRGIASSLSCWGCN